MAFCCSAFGWTAEEFLNHTRGQIAALLKGLTTLEKNKYKAMKKTHNHPTPTKTNTKKPPRTEKEYADLEHWFKKYERCRRTP